VVPWESLRPKLKASLITGGLRASDVARKSPDVKTLWLDREALVSLQMRETPEQVLKWLSSGIHRRRPYKRRHNPCIR
jgi:hypothetical protein